MPKYGNKKVVIDGIKFDSAKEGRRWQDLKMLYKVGKIRELDRQRVFILAPSVVLHGRRKPALRYCADFVYIDDATGKTVVEDVKGVQTDVFRVKMHLMKSVHGIDLLIT